MQATLLGMSYTIPGYHVILRDRITVLRRYIEASQDTDLELEVLYAAQAFNLEVGNPPGFLHRLFDALADEDVVEEETFFDWLNCNDPGEQAGKEDAVVVTENFFKMMMDFHQEQEEEDRDAGSHHASSASSSSHHPPHRRTGPGRFAYFGIMADLPSVPEN